MIFRHRLLARQARKYLGPEPALAPEWQRLLCAVQEAYDQFDNDRRLTERAMDLSSNELVAANERLLAQNQANLAVLEKLRNSVRVLRAASGGAEHPVEDDVLVLTAVLDDLIRQRRNAEQALRESEERLQNIVDNTSAVIFVKDLELRYILVNREFERRHHVERDQIRGKTDFDIHPPDVAEALRANDERVIRAGEPIQFEEAVPSDGSQHIYVSAKFLLRDHLRKPYAVSRRTLRRQSVRRKCKRLWPLSGRSLLRSERPSWRRQTKPSGDVWTRSHQFLNWTTSLGK